MTALLLAFALLCPPDGEVYNAYLILGVNRNGVPIGPNPINPGDTLRINADLIYGPDPMGRKTLAFGGGSLRVRIGDIYYDLTPPAGIPTLGPPECAASNWFRATMDYQVLTNAPAFVTAEYRFNYCPECPIGSSSTVVSVKGFRVNQTGPIIITNPAPGTVTLSFYAISGSYEIQATDDMATWAVAGNTSPVEGKATWSTAIEGNNRMYRLRRL